MEKTMNPEPSMGAAPPLRRNHYVGNQGRPAVTPFVYDIVLVDDHYLVRQEVKKIVEADTALRVVEECADGLELLDCLNRRPFHLVILDISMPQLGGLEATRLIKASHPQTKVLLLTLHKRREYLFEAQAAGAEGYLLKDEMDKELLPAIATLRQGGTYFSTLESD
jgi:two-component system, NarL family, response regulator NreC